jgi:hypothetical protein
LKIQAIHFAYLRTQYGILACLDYNPGTCIGTRYRRVRAFETWNRNRPACRLVPSTELQL